MALQLPLADSDVGAAFPAAYARIFFGRTFAEQVVITVYFYADEAARRADKAMVQQRDYTAPCSELVMEGNHPHVPFYNWLKTLPEFAGAVDV